MTLEECMKKKYQSLDEVQRGVVCEAVVSGELDLMQFEMKSEEKDDGGVLHMEEKLSECRGCDRPTFVEKLFTNAKNLYEMFSS